MTGLLLVARPAPAGCSRVAGALLAAALVALLGAPRAAAAPPPNDAQAAPQAITLTADVTGTTYESTLEPTEPALRCGPAPRDRLVCVHGARRRACRGPGLELRNFARASGHLNGRGVDVVDLYRFDVTSRSELTLALSTRGSPTFDVVLLNDSGRRIASARSDSGGTELRRRLRPGRFFAAVRAVPGARPVRAAPGVAHDHAHRHLDRRRTAAVATGRHGADRWFT